MSESNGRIKLVANPDVQPEVWDVEDFVSLRGDAKFADRGKEIIEGLLREGEVMLIGSSSKHGKSWLVGNLIWSAILGSYWLGKLVTQGKVLLIDNELKRGEIDWRHSMIAHELDHQPKEGQLKVISRRGKSCDVQAIQYQLEKSGIVWSEYSLIVIDAMYKVIPDGKSENDNEAMGKLMNTLQGIAESTGVPVVGVHHSTKGSQGDKAVLDVFAGAGSFGRSLDSAVVIRDHEQPELSVIDFMTRSNPPQPTTSAKFDWPLWKAVTATPELRQVSRKSADKQAAEDAKSKAELLEAIPVKPKRIQQKTLRGKFPYGVGKFDRLIGGLVHEKRVRISRKKEGRTTFVYYTRLPDDSENGSENDSEKN
jgi:hypothetical protein